MEYTIGVIIPCMAAFAKFAKRVSTNVKSYYNHRSFRRASSTEKYCDLNEVAIKSAEKEKAGSQTNTIDRMLSQMFPRDETNLSKLRDEHDGYE